MRPPRLQHREIQSLPLSFSYHIHPDSQSVDLVISAPENLSAVLLDGLALMSHFVHEAKRQIEAGYRELRTQATLDALEAKYAQIRHAYQVLRRSGSKHRAAVKLLVADESLPFYGHNDEPRWTYTVFNWCVRSAPAHPPTLTSVPKTKPTKGAAS